MLHYLHRSHKLLKSVNLDYSYDTEKKEYAIKNYNRDNHLLTCRKYIVPYLEITVQKKVNHVKAPMITLGYTSCSWRCRSANEPLELINDGDDEVLEIGRAHV